MVDGTVDTVARVLQAIQELSLADELVEVQRIARTAARDLIGCDGATFVLRDGEQCFYADEDAVAPLWKGLRFPIDSCISGWAMKHREQVVIPDIYVDDRIPHAAYRPTFVQSLVMTPIRSMQPIGAIGAYWADHHQATDDELGLLKTLADATSLALAKVSVQQELDREVEQAHEAHRLSSTDELTGLLNRRGFRDAVERAFTDSPADARAAVAFLDLDGLKAVNDEQGHDAGDRLIKEVAAALRDSLRPHDVVGRMGGDEFAVVAFGLEPSALAGRIAEILDDRGSVGAAELTSMLALPDAVLAADALMYADKRSRLAQRVA